MDTRLIAILILLVLLVLMVVLVRRLASGDGLDERLQAYAALPDLSRRREGKRSRGLLARLRLRLNTTLGGLTTDEMALQLMSANWPITPVEYSLIRLGFTFVALALVGLITGNLLAGIGAAILTYILPGFLLKRAISRRQRAFEKQLVDVLVLITGAVRSGFSLLQAMEVVVRELAAPASQEFRRVLQEVSLGRPVGVALENMALRMENRDLDLLVTAIKIQYTVGGNLTTMLEAVTETIRERIRLFGEVRALTSQQKLASYVISFLPIVVAAILFILSPTYMRGLFNRQYIFIPTIAAVMMVLGIIIIQRMARIDL
jgi:tight adherence protein B